MNKLLEEFGRMEGMALFQPLELASVKSSNFGFKLIRWLQSILLKSNPLIQSLLFIVVFIDCGSIDTMITAGFLFLQIFLSFCIVSDGGV
jgi:hypothetical protein